jgi:hypothetical protein
MHTRTRAAWEVHWSRRTLNIETDRLLDVTSEALPTRPLASVAPHLPGTSIPDTEETEVMHLRHLYSVRTRPELHTIDADAPDVTITTLIDGWQARARAQGRLLYDCAPCKITWLVAHDADTCPLGHDMGE